MAFRSKIAAFTVLDGKKKKYSVELSATPFHLSGGGQPGDSGTLRGEGFLFRVEDARKEEGKALLSGVLMEGALSAGMDVEAEVDMERHLLFSRMHTGEHILSKALETGNPPLRVFKVAIAGDESTVFLTFPGEITWELLFSAEDEANRIAALDLPVETMMMSREDAENLSGIKGNWGRIQDESIRVVRIPGYDLIACSGSHVKATGEVGEIFVTGFRGTAPDWEIKFSVDGSGLSRTYSREARKLVRRIGCRISQLGDVVQALQDENAALKKSMEKAASFLSLPWEEHEGEPEVYTASMSEMPKNAVTNAARRWADAHPCGISIVLLKEGEGEGCSFLLYRGKDVHQSFSSFLRESPGLSARGGGREDWLNGVSAECRPSAWADAVRAFAAGKRD
mgnify:CR=1 FL=1